MGVGLYSVSCGYGCGCGFGGLTSLIAMVLALRAREALRMGGSLRMVMGGKVFSGPSLSWLARQCARSVGIRSHGFALRVKPRVGSCAPNAASPFGRPVQHLRRPSRSSAWFKGGVPPPRAGASALSSLLSVSLLVSFLLVVMCFATCKLQMGRVRHFQAFKWH